MPLYLIAQCCKCKGSISKDIWAIKWNHGYLGRRYVCEHFDVEIDNESSPGILGWKWRNTITVIAYYKPCYCRKVIFTRTFNKGNTEYQDYKIFNNKVVFHARVSDDYNQYPDIGNNHQNDIEYNEKREQQRRERERRERERREEQRRQLQRECDLQLGNLIEREKEKEKEKEEKDKMI